MPHGRRATPTPFARGHGVPREDHTFPSLFYDERMVGSSFYSVRMIELLENQVWERSKAGGESGDVPHSIWSHEAGFRT